MLMSGPNSVGIIDPRTEFYGDEQGRLEALRGLTYTAFKQHLFDIRNSLPGREPESEYGFVQQQNTRHGILAGEFFPMPQDKDELLAYALKEAQAQEDIQISALVLGVAVLAVHPYEDGNGGTYRSVYSELSRGLTPSSPEYKAAQQPHSKLVDLGMMIDTESPYRLVSQVAFLKAGVKKIADQAWPISKDTSAAAEHYNDREFHGLSIEERAMLDAQLGDKENNPPGRFCNNSAAILFGFSRLAVERQIGLPIDEAPAGHSQVNVPDTLAMINEDAKRELLKYIQQYPAYKALAAIDLLGKDGDTILHLPDGINIAVRDLLLQYTNNYLMSHVRIEGALL
jgi:hypothetical protein